MNPILLLQSANENTGVALPIDTRVALAPAVEKRNSLADCATCSGGTLTVKRTGYFRLLASAEAMRVTDFRVFVTDNARSQDHFANGSAPLNSEGQADGRIQVALNKTLFLNEGETVSIGVYQNGTNNAELWAYPDTVFIEVEYLGY